MTKALLVALLVIVFTSCKKKIEQPVMKTLTTVKAVPVTKTFYYPEEAGTVNNGVVVINSDTIDVATTYTDEVQMVQKGDDEDANIYIHNYRNAIIHLIDRHTKDTLSFTKDFFRKDIDPAEFNDVFLSGAIIVNGKLSCSICPPDSDDCYEFWIGINTNSQITKKLFTRKEYDRE